MLIQLARKTGAQKLNDDRKPEVVVLPKRTGRSVSVVREFSKALCGLAARCAVADPDAGLGTGLCPKDSERRNDWELPADRCGGSLSTAQRRREDNRSYSVLTGN